MKSPDRSDQERIAAKAVTRPPPFLFPMSAPAFAERANVGFAKKPFRLDTALSDAVSAFGACCFFFGYALREARDRNGGAAIPQPEGRVWHGRRRRSGRPRFVSAASAFNP